MLDEVVVLKKDNIMVGLWVVLWMLVFKKRSRPDTRVGWVAFSDVVRGYFFL